MPHGPGQIQFIRESGRRCAAAGVEKPLWKWLSRAELARNISLRRPGVAASEQPQDHAMTDHNAERFDSTSQDHRVACHPDLAKPVLQMNCSCCLRAFHGRQYRWQSEGSGLGDCCIEHIDRGLMEREALSDQQAAIAREEIFGVAGVHYNLRVSH